MRIGFTGTRFGMTQPQRASVKGILELYKTPDIETHHGNCVGADDEFHDLAGRVNAIRVIHPPSDTKLEANNPFFNEIRERKTHFARNRDIVDETDFLVAAPYHDSEQERGGTWYTVKYAEKRGKPVVIVWPNGLLSRPLPEPCRTSGYVPRPGYLAAELP